MRKLKMAILSMVMCLCLFSISLSNPIVGDINANGFEYEVADWLLFYIYLLGSDIPGHGTFHISASDINFDQSPASIADFNTFSRVLWGFMQPLKGPVFPVQYQTGDLLSARFQSANPGDTVVFPIYLRNSLTASGLSFNLTYDPSSLAFIGSDISSGRLSFWNSVDTVYYDYLAHIEGDVNSVASSGRLFVFAFCYQCLSNASHDIFDKTLPPGEGPLLLLKFVVSNDAPPNTLLPITFLTEDSLGHYNAYADTLAPVRLILPAVVSTGIYTGSPQPGDVYTDGRKDIVDIVYLVNYLFKGFLPPNPISLGDMNSDGKIDLEDVILLGNEVF